MLFGFDTLFMAACSPDEHSYTDEPLSKNPSAHGSESGREDVKIPNAGLYVQIIST